MKQKNEAQVPASVRRRKSLFVAFGWYSKSDWNVRVFQITRNQIRLIFFRSVGNAYPPQKPEHKTIQQMRALCLQETKRMAESYYAHFAGVRAEVWFKTSARLAKLHGTSYTAVNELLNLAVSAFGNCRNALRWLSCPVPKFGNRTPLRVARSDYGALKVQDELLRARFAALPDLRIDVETKAIADRLSQGLPRKHSKPLLRP
jgi:hypothetical protein